MRECGKLPEQFRLSSLSLRLTFVSLWVLRRKLTRPVILAALVFIADMDPAAVVVEMWQRASDAGFQAPGERSTRPVYDSRWFARRVISAANLWDAAHSW